MTAIILLYIFYLSAISRLERFPSVVWEACDTKPLNNIYVGGVSGALSILSRLRLCWRGFRTPKIRRDGISRTLVRLIVCSFFFQSGGVELYYNFATIFE